MAARAQARRPLITQFNHAFYRYDLGQMASGVTYDDVLIDC